MCRWSSCVSSCFGVCSYVMSLFCLGCVKPLPLPKGADTFFIQVILLFVIVSSFNYLFDLFCSFLFVLFFSLISECVCCQCTHQGGVEDFCGPRTGGWSLLGVMSY
jgi:hypothetical protein